MAEYTDWSGVLFKVIWPGTLVLIPGPQSRDSIPVPLSKLSSQTVVY